MRTVQTVRTVGAVLKASGYRSAHAVIDQAILDAVENGHTIAPAVNLAARRVRRACERGLGPPRRTAPFPVDKFDNLPDTLAPLSPGGPAWPRRTLFAGSWWLTREVELAAARVRHISVDSSGVS